METMDMYSDKIVDAYRAVSRHIVSGARGRAPAWPFSILETTIFYSKFFSKELLKVMKDLEGKGYNRNEIAKMFYGPSAVSHWLYLAGFPFEGLSREEVIDFIERTIEVIEFWRREDSFCINWSNVIWDENTIKKECAKEGFIDTRNNESFAKCLGKINMIVWHYCILIQVGHRNYSHEFHGPYNIGNGELLFVREYFNLRPYEIWPFATFENIPFNKIIILEIYKDVEIKVDMFNHYLAPSDLKSHLQRFLVRVDDFKILTEKEIKDLFGRWTGIISKANTFVRDYTKKDWVKKIIEMKYWLLKPHKKILEEDWHAPKEVLNLAEKYKEVEEIAMKAIQGQIKKISNYPEEVAKKNITQIYLDNIYEGKMYY
jgi:hypothetical protein